jgi:hypothetical protein
MSKIKISDIDATGTRDSTTFLRGDGTFNVPPGGGGGGGGGGASNAVVVRKTSNQSLTSSWQNVTFDATADYDSASIYDGVDTFTAPTGSVAMELNFRSNTENVSAGSPRYVRIDVNGNTVGLDITSGINESGQTLNTGVIPVTAGDAINVLALVPAGADMAGTTFGGPAALTLRFYNAYSQLNGGGGGGGGSAFLPMAQESGIDFTVDSAAFGPPLLFLTQGIAGFAQTITGVRAPMRAIGSGYTLEPCLYGGIDPATTTPSPSGATRVALGPGVALTTANTIYSLPFTTPVVLTPGLVYYLGFSAHGGSGNLSLAALGSNRVEYFNSAVFNPPPNPAPSMNTFVANNCGWWAY